MWVDSDASRRGGRELWGYPKELAEIALRIAPGGEASATSGGRELARGDFRPRLTLPFRLRWRTGTVQAQGNRLRPVRIAMGARVSLGSGRLSAPPGSPLAFLRDARRLFGIGLGDFDAVFGTESDVAVAAESDPAAGTAAEAAAGAAALSADAQTPSR